MKIAFNRRNKHLGEFLEAIRDFYECNGHTCLFLSRAEKSPPKINALVIWNGSKPSMQRLVNHSRRCGAQTIYAEHGHFRLRTAWQLDVAGINTTSTNRMWMSFPWPTDEERNIAAGRRRKFSKDSGIFYEEPGDYILVALQVATDVNITKFAPQFVDQQVFIRTVEQAIRKVTKIPIVFRQHPKLDKQKKNPPLAKHLNRCRYMITINSNTVHEALMAQKDCICLGPQIYNGMANRTPGGGGVVFTAMGRDLKKLPSFIRAAEERLESGASKNDLIRDQYINYVYDREWTMSDIRRGDHLLALLEGRPKPLNCRVEMHPEWHKLKDGIKLRN